MTEVPDLFAQYADVIRSATPDEIRRDVTLGGRLVLERDGNLAVSYAPLDYVNTRARIVLVGITPGRQQAENALLEARRQVLSGASPAETARAAKGVASFSGPMRVNLITMLDYFGVHDVLGIRSCVDLFGRHADLVHYTSALRYPVFVDGKNYSGVPAMVRHPMLRRYLESYFGADTHQLGKALFVPLGGKVATALRSLQEAGHLRAEQILDGFQHPSGANAERIAYLLGRKPRERLSTKTDPLVIDRARDLLRARIADLKRASF